MPIPGHNLLSERVITRARHTRKAFDRVQLQGGQRLPLSSAELHRLPPPSERPGLISEDISGGLETVRAATPRSWCPQIVPFPCLRIYEREGTAASSICIEGVGRAIRCMHMAIST